MIIYPIDYKIWKPWIFSWCLEQLVKQLETFLPKVIPKHLEGHYRAVLKQTLRKERQSHVIHVIVGHVQVDERLVYCQRLSHVLHAKVRAPVGS